MKTNWNSLISITNFNKFDSTAKHFEGLLENKTREIENIHIFCCNNTEFFKYLKHLAQFKKKLQIKI